MRVRGSRVLGLQLTRCRSPVSPQAICRRGNRCWKKWDDLSFCSLPRRDKFDSQRISLDLLGVGDSRVLREFFVMDGISTAEQRDIERVFQVDRHSMSVLATAFERLSAAIKLPEHQLRSVRDTQEDPSKSQLQEAR